MRFGSVACAPPASYTCPASKSRTSSLPRFKLKLTILSMLGTKDVRMTEASSLMGLASANAGVEENCLASFSEMNVGEMASS